MADDRRERFLKDIRLLSEISDLKQDLSPDKGDLDRIKYPFQKGLELAGYAYDLEAAIAECLDAVFPAIPYCIDLLEGPRLTTNESRLVAFRPKGK